MTYRLNSPQVVHEVFEGEVILVNLDAGAYYSVDGPGARALVLLLAGVPIPELATGLAVEFVGSEEAIRADLARLVDRLQEEQLVREAGAASAPEPVAAESPTGLPWAAPELHKYTDMRDLLLLDPIHDVDDAGWPSRPPEPPSRR